MASHGNGEDPKSGVISNVSHLLLARCTDNLQDGPKMAPKWPQRGSKMAARWPQNGSKMAPNEHARFRLQSSWGRPSKGLIYGICLFVVSQTVSTWKRKRHVPMIFSMCRCMGLEATDKPNSVPYNSAEKPIHRKGCQIIMPLCRHHSYAQH